MTGRVWGLESEVGSQEKTSATTDTQRFRRAKAADLTGLLALERRCFPVADLFHRETWRRLCGHSQEAGSAIVLVAGPRGLPTAAGVALLRRGSTVCRIYSLAVDAALRGQRIGERLVWALADRARRSHHCTVLSLEVRRDNLPALNLYLRLGFTVTAELPGYYADGGDGLRLRREWQGG